LFKLWIIRKYFLQAWFYEKNKGLDVIPNYFQPLKKENNEVLFACKLDYEYRIFKGNSNQDRPYVI
jgi:hypothetical protein